MQKLLKNSELSLRFSLLWGATLGVGYVLWLLPLDHLVGTTGLWSIGDPGAHVSALRAYLNDQWHWPILHTRYLNYPEGINAAFADIIPLAAVPTKLIANWLPGDFHYFGYWLVFGYLMQGLAAAWLLHLTGFRDRIGLPLAVMFFLLSPAMLFRVHAHVALTFHAIILIALAMYFLMSRPGGVSNRSLVIWLALTSCAALLIHPYLLAMVVPILVAGLFDRARLTDYGLWNQLAVLAGMLTPVFFIMWVGGYLTHGIGQLSGGGGFGYNSMNLTAPLVGGGIWSPNNMLDSSGQYGTLPMPYNATGGQFEGYNHLGLGVLIGLLLIVATQIRRLPKLVQRHAGLFLLMAGFTLYAISNKAFFAGTALWDIPLPLGAAPLVEQFRASGRFFWPVGYLLLLCVILGLSSFTKHNFGLFILAALLVIQFFDTAPLRGVTREVTRIEAPTLMSNMWWQSQAEQADRIYLFPTFGCGADPFADVVPLQRLAAFSATPFNTGLIARGAGGCEEKESVLVGGLIEGRLYVFLDGYFDAEALSERFGSHTFQRCQRFQYGHVCVP